ncbi:hypothetical protein OAF43_01400 [bacterium]|nr:hypothetical protein [bacterium]
MKSTAQYKSSRIYVTKYLCSFPRTKENSVYPRLTSPTQFKHLAIP